MKLINELKKEDTKQYIKLWFTILICIILIIIGDMLRES